MTIKFSVMFGGLHGEVQAPFETFFCEWLLLLKISVCVNFDLMVTVMINVFGFYS